MKDAFRALVFVSLLGAAIVLIVQIAVDLVDTWLAARDAKIYGQERPRHE